MEKTFSEKIDELYSEAYEYIEKVLRIRGTNYELAPPDDSFSEIVSNGGFTIKNDVNELVALNVIDFEENDELSFITVKGVDEYDDDETIDIEHLMFEDIIRLADFIMELEEGK